MALGLPKRISKVCIVLSHNISSTVYLYIALIKETHRLMSEPVPGISAVPDEKNARYFHVVVDGPADVR